MSDLSPIKCFVASEWNDTPEIILFIDFDNDIRNVVYEYMNVESYNY